MITEDAPEHRAQNMRGFNYNYYPGIKIGRADCPTLLINIEKRNEMSVIGRISENMN